MGYGLYLLILLFTALQPAPARAENFRSQFSQANSPSLSLMGADRIEAWLDLAQPTTVAVIDSGVSLLNPFLNPYLLIGDEKARSFDFVHRRPFQIDDNGHGSHVASIVAAINPKARILALKVLDGGGNGQVQDTVDAIYYAVDAGAKVINLSLGALDMLGENRVVYEAVVAWARLHDVLIIAAAGNESSDNDQFAFYPSNVMQDNLMSVCAVDATGELAGFSNYGAWRVHVCAPGVSIVGLGHQYLSKPWLVQSGTSQAAPAVSALASLLFGLNPELKPYQVRDAIMSSVSTRESLRGSSQSMGIIHFERTLQSVFW